MAVHIWYLLQLFAPWLSHKSYTTIKDRGSNGNAGEGVGESE